jgi:uncharacterized protein (TIGR03435 family)
VRIARRLEIKTFLVPQALDQAFRPQRTPKRAWRGSSNGEIAISWNYKALLLVVAMVMARSLTSAAQATAPQLMAADGKPIEFDVVSVKPNRSGSTPMNILSPPMSDGVTITNMPLEDILHWAFGIHLSEQMSGLPDWARQERYDVTAKVGEADAEAFHKVIDPIERMPMLRKILADRFHLISHYEMRDLPVYALVVGKSGIRMTEIQPAIGTNGMKEGGGREVKRSQIKSMGQLMKPLVNQLTREMGRLVVDR